MHILYINLCINASPRPEFFIFANHAMRPSFALTSAPQCWVDCGRNPILRRPCLVFPAGLQRRSWNSGGHDNGPAAWGGHQSGLVARGSRPTGPIQRRCAARPRRVLSWRLSTAGGPSIDGLQSDPPRACRASSTNGRWASCSGLHHATEARPPAQSRPSWPASCGRPPSPRLHRCVAESGRAGLVREQRVRGARDPLALGACQEQTDHVCCIRSVDAPAASRAVRTKRCAAGRATYVLVRLRLVCQPRPLAKRRRCRRPNPERASVILRTRLGHCRLYPGIRWQVTTGHVQGATPRRAVDPGLCPNALGAPHPGRRGRVRPCERHLASSTAL